MCKCQLQYCTLQSLSLYQNSALDRSSPAESTECSDESGIPWFNQCKIFREGWNLTLIS